MWIIFQWHDIDFSRPLPDQKIKYLRFYQESRPGDIAAQLGGRWLRRSFDAPAPWWQVPGEPPSPRKTRRAGSGIGIWPHRELEIRQGVGLRSPCTSFPRKFPEKTDGKLDGVFTKRLGREHYGVNFVEGLPSLLRGIYVTGRLDGAVEPRRPHFKVIDALGLHKVS